MKFYSLGSGSKGNCMVILHENTCLVVDCGLSQKYIKQRLAELEVDLSQVNALLLTHGHKDHIEAINMFKGINQYACFEKDGVKQIDANQKIKIADLSVQAIMLSHDSPHTCGYIIEAGYEKMVYMTDTGYVPKRLLSSIHNAHYYFIEANHDIEMLMKTQRPHHVKARIYSDQGHLCNEDCAAVLMQCIGPSTRQVTLAHLSDEANSPQLALQVVSDALSKHPLYPRVHVQVALQNEVCEGGSL